jgi:sialidase-1
MASARRSRSRPLLLVASLALASTLCGCAGSASPAPSEHGSTSPAVSPSPAATPATPASSANWVVRDNLRRSYDKFAAKGTGRVAFLGGSVTTLGWRDGVADYLERKFPDTTFDFVEAGLAGTPAELGAFRLEEDVFGRGQVDLLFLEFAVNEGSVEAMEGIVRHAKALNPDIDIVQMHIAARWFSDQLDQGSVPGTILNHERVAAHYGNSSLHLYREIHDRMKAGEFGWDEFAPDGVHPTAFGCSVYAAYITAFLEATWSSGGVATHPPLPAPLTAHPWEHGTFVHYRTATSMKGFEEVKDWTPALVGNLKGPISFIASSKAGSTITFRFKGTIVGLCVPVGGDAAKIEYSVDGAPWKVFDTARDSWYPSDYVRLAGFVLDTSLSDGEHTITLRTIADSGHVFRLYRLMVG